MGLLLEYACIHLACIRWCNNINTASQQRFQNSTLKAQCHNVLTNEVECKSGKVGMVILTACVNPLKYINTRRTKQSFI